ncbi:MAG TPA: site-2 protease family protein [Thermomicrobiales bacterium]|nr:site-2 protease family protein [Thermomicrobiales bacterium]
MTASWRLLTIRGIDIGLHWSMVIVFGLLTVSLATAYFPETSPDLSEGAAWIMAVVAAVFFFASILFHELGHSFVALRYELPVDRITLFIFGGIAQISERAKSADVELKVAAAGPAVSFALSAIFGLAWFVTQDIDVIAAPALWLATLSLILALFNLLPGFPLDGGRILRALVWSTTGNERKAARVAMVSGQFVAFGLIGLGALLMFTGNFTNGLWLIFIGWFLQNAAVSEATGTSVEIALRGAEVRQAMGPAESQVPGRLMLRQLIDEYVLPAGERHFIVVDGDTPRGIVTLRDITQVPQDRWDWTPIREIMKPWSQLTCVTPDSKLLDAMKIMDEKQVRQLPVIENDEALGLLTREEVLRYVRLRMELEDGEPDERVVAQ